MKPDTSAAIQDKIKRRIFYAGLKREDYYETLPLAIDRNRKNLVIYSGIAALFFIVLCVVNTLTRNFADINQTMYIVCCIAMITIHVISRRLSEGQTRHVMPLSYVFMAVLYTFSLSISFLHSDVPAVTFIVMLYALPSIFIDRPINQIVIICFVTAIFCLLTYFLKPASVVASDIWNAVSFAALAIVVQLTFGQTGMWSLWQEEQIRFMGSHDLLTGIKNRNCYESELRTMPLMCKSLLSCVFADVNGLHELNNTKGHESGDLMLKVIAAEISRYFGKYTYRTGGDEFVAFLFDTPADTAAEYIGKVNEHIKDYGYYVSFGCSQKTVPDIDMAKLVSEAELNMYADKERFYEKTGMKKR